jgi:hypothetical protein
MQRGGQATIQQSYAEGWASNNPTIQQSNSLEEIKINDIYII